jgi:hypothetical protein
MFTIDHALPFHRSANSTCTLSELLKLPTARQALEAPQETPLKWLVEGGPPGVGVGWIDQPA